MNQMHTRMDEETLARLRKRRLRPWIAAFFGAVLFFTFFSATFERLTLPKAAVEKPEPGRFERVLEGEGRLAYGGETEVYPEADWTVASVEVAEGDEVRAGDLLATLDPEDARRTLADEEDRLLQQELRLAGAREEWKEAARLEDAKRKAEAVRQLESIEADMRIQRRKLDELRAQLATGGDVRAPEDGVVTKVNAAAGKPASRSQPLFVFAPKDEGFVLTFTADAEDAAAVAEGDAVSVSVAGSDGRFERIEGTVETMEETAAADGGAGGGGSGAVRIAIRLDGPGLAEGMAAQVEERRPSGRPGMLVPAKALHADGSGEFVYALEERKGALGNEYRLRKAYVTVSDKNDDQALVTGGVMPDERIVTETSEPVSEGDRVRLE